MYDTILLSDNGQRVIKRCIKDKDRETVFSF